MKRDAVDIVIVGAGAAGGVLMIENYRSGFIWQLMRGCQPLVQGLRRAGFQGGWLSKERHVREIE